MFALIAVLAGITFVLTRVLSRRLVARTRKASSLPAVVGVFCSALIMVFIVYGRDLFTRGFWNGKAPMLIAVPMFFGVCMVISLIPALLIVRHYQKRSRDENRVP